MTFTGAPPTVTQRCSDRQSTSSHDVPWRVATSSVRRSAAPGSATHDYASAVAGSCRQPCASPSTSTSTLHHYWDVLSRPRGDRFGVELPYEEQFTWGITLLKPQQLEVCIDETHGDARSSPPRPTRARSRLSRAWHEAGTSSTSPATGPSAAEGATATWLQRIGLPYDELYCSYDKVARCREIGIDLLVDDAP